MIDFHCLTPEYRERLHDLLYAAGRQGCEYSFANLYLWGRQQVSLVQNFLVVFSHYRGRSVYLYPVGTGDPKPALDALRADAKARGSPLRITGLTRAETEKVESLYPGQFHFSPDRDGFDYIYDIGRLSNLSGKKLQQKRNHVNRFLREHPDWHTEPITADNLPLCRNFLDRWYTQHKLLYPHSDFKMEQVALDRAFRHFDTLGMEGLVLFAEGQMAAMTLGNNLSPDTWDVNFEKADPDIEGAYPMINREYARYIRTAHPEIRFLNREDDMGLPGLRKAKESYYPDILLEKFTAILLESYGEG